ncbi:MAG: NAD(P)-dependent glycerol-3-phosphate dehydrogenase [Isosphaeraceae bacterium]|nr:NAD(P)-dependent glycerol-3-phosphate dehydrogenase [Isosphaeraceae bacterium]
MKRVAILGAGGMGTALAVLFARSVRSVQLWPRDPVRAAELARTRENARHLPGVALPDNVSVMANACDATGGAELIVAAIPSAFLRATLAGLAEKIPPRIPVLSVIKGIENNTFARPSQIIAETLGPRSIAILSGPGHAEELARGLPASLVVAGTDDAVKGAVRDALNQLFLRVYTNTDALGVELAGALKNVLAIAAGVCDGLRFGDNAKAALITRGVVEITRFGVHFGAVPETFQGLAGIGDVLTTCYSAFGRNRAVGERIGQGATLEQALAETVNVAEGVPTTRSVHDLATRHGVDMPITRALYQVLFEGKTPVDAVTEFMLRSPKVEWQP